MACIAAVDVHLASAHDVFNISYFPSVAGVTALSSVPDIVGLPAIVGVLGMTKVVDL